MILKHDVECNPQGPFPNLHVISHSKDNTITYQKPTIPPDVDTTPTMASCNALHILCTHHQNTPIGSYKQAQQPNPITYKIWTHNRPDRAILESMVQMLQFHTQLTRLYKVKVHANIDGNKQAHNLVKKGLRTRLHTCHSNVLAHAPDTYSFHKYWWHSMHKTQGIGPIRHLKKYILKHDKEYAIGIIAYQTHKPRKWLENGNIGKNTIKQFMGKPIHNRQTKI